MIPYVTTAFNKDEGGLRTEDVSRMSYQLFSAVDHCAKHGVIHRDIKPREFYYFFCIRTPGLSTSNLVVRPIMLILH